MVRSTAISWKIGLAVAASTLSLWQVPALADDGPAEKVETRPQPIEPKVVRVILLPPASDALFASRHPELAEAAPIILVQPTGNAAIARPRPEPVKIQEPEPATIQREDPTSVENPSSPERSPRVALLPPASNAASASPRPEPAKTQKGAILAAIPSLPARSPFRQAPFKSELVENEPKAAATEPAPAKVNSAFNFLTNLWPGNKRTSAPVSSTVEGSPSSASDGKAGSPAPTTASASAPLEQDPAEAGPKSDKPTSKQKPAYFLDVIQFWKN